MGKRDLEDIKERLRDARKFTRETKRKAERVGDKEGAAKIDEIVKTYESVEKHFGGDK